MIDERLSRREYRELEGVDPVVPSTNPHRLYWRAALGLFAMLVLALYLAIALAVAFLT